MAKHKTAFLPHFLIYLVLAGITILCFRVHLLLGIVSLFFFVINIPDLIADMVGGNEEELRAKKPKHTPHSCKRMPNIGAVGLAKHDLRPQGRIVVDGNTYEALSQAGFIPQNTPIRITEVQTDRCIVEQAS